MERRKPGPRSKTPEQKKLTTAICLTREEKAMLEALADQSGVSSSAVVAELIRKAAKQLKLTQINSN